MTLRLYDGPPSGEADASSDEEVREASGDAQHAGDSDDQASKRASELGAHLRLPERRNASPWSKGILLAALVGLILSVPLWIDPVTLAELRGAGPTPAALALAHGARHGGSRVTAVGEQRDTTIARAKPRTGTRLYVAGGQQRGTRPLTSGPDGWYEYERGLILEVDQATGDADVVVDYKSPPEACPDQDPAILFKSGTLVGDLLYICTQTEVLVYRVPSFERVAYVSLPMFNDVHHVRPTPGGNLLVANTGLDMVVEVTTRGDVVQIWNVLGEDPWGSRFFPDVDYRKVKTTKPHLAHPNHVFHIGDEPWATRFQQKDAISLVDPGRRIEIGLERVHDGLVHGERVYFTTVDGKVAIADTRSLEVVQVLDLTRAHPDDMLLGWARSVFVDGDYMWVGFSRIRPTKLRENVGWVLRGLKRDFGTHIGCYDLRTGESVAQIGVERLGLSAVFGIFPAPQR